MRHRACVIFAVWFSGGVFDAARGEIPSSILAKPATVIDRARPIESGDATRPLSQSVSYRSFEGPLGSLEQELFADAADNELNQHGLLAACLIASGMDELSEVRRYEAQMERWTGQLKASGLVLGPPLQKAQAVFEFMHRRILTAGYTRECTDLRRALDEGRFNCVSATVIFSCLAPRCGLRVCGLETPGHAMCRLRLDTESFDIETTCPRWFAMADDPQAREDLIRRTLGLRAGDASPRKPCREVGALQLAAMIYYNRGVDLLAEERFAEAASANAKALRLDRSSETARGNLLAVLNNWAIWLGTAGQYMDAASRLQQGLALDPHYAIFATNFQHVHYEWSESLCREGAFAEAVEKLRAAAAHRPNDTFFVNAQVDVFRRWVHGLLAANRVDEAFAVLDDASRLLGANARLAECELGELNDHAVGLLDGQRPEEALAFLDRAVARRPESIALVDNRRVAVMRWAESAFRSGDYGEAIRRTTYGAVPGQVHPDLLNNVRFGYRQWIVALRASGHASEAEQVALRQRHDPFLNDSP